MKQFFSFFFILLLFSIIEIGQTGCANIIPPTGGARDSLPPVLVHSTPKDSSNNIQPNKIVLTFNEFVEVKDITQNLLVSPLMKNTPQVDYKFKTVTIKLKDSLEPNTTYSLNFGNSIVDLNENNPFKNFTYIFSTGGTIDSNSVTGKVFLAETGKTDSTLIAVLYRNTSDTAVLKQKPNYMARVKGDGSFTFNNLPKANFALYVLPDDYTKKYDDSTKMFAFADSIISVDKNTIAPTLFAFEEAKRKAPTSSSNSNNNKPAVEKDKRIKYTIALSDGKQDLLSNEMPIEFSRKIKAYDSNKILLCDTNYKKLSNYTILMDSTNTKLFVKHNWKEDTHYRLLLQKDAVVDTTNAAITKTDTIRFTSKKTSEYGSVKIRFNNLDTTKHPVLLIMKESFIVESIVIKQRDFYRKLYAPGEYSLKVLFDTNGDGVWTTGNYKKRLQPEIVRHLTKKLSIRANWDNESEINL